MFYCVKKSNSLLIDNYINTFIRAINISFNSLMLTAAKSSLTMLMKAQLGSQENILILSPGLELKFLTLEEIYLSGFSALSFYSIFTMFSKFPIKSVCLFLLPPGPFLE